MTLIIVFKEPDRKNLKIEIVRPISIFNAYLVIDNGYDDVTYNLSDIELIKFEDD
jgi:hypothetical protein